MPKDELQKHTLHLFEGDYDRLRDFFPDTPPAVTVRLIIRNFIKKYEVTPKEEVEDVQIELLGISYD